LNRNIISALLIIVVSSLLFFCSEDKKVIKNDQPFVEIPLGDIRGEYFGFYERTLDYKSIQSNEQTDRQNIKLTLSDLHFLCEVIDTNIYPRFTCDFTGYYTLGTNTAQLEISSVECAFDTIDIPHGDFTITRLSNSTGHDSLILEEWDVTKCTFKTIRVAK